MIGSDLLLTLNLRVPGSIPGRLTSFFSTLCGDLATPSIGLRLRLGCVRLRHHRADQHPSGTHLAGNARRRGT